MKERSTCTPEITGDMVDRLLTVEIRNADREDRDLIPAFYDYARSKLGGKSLSLMSAQQLVTNVEK